MAAKSLIFLGFALAAAGCAGPARSAPEEPVPGGVDALVRDAVFIASEGPETRYRVRADRGVYSAETQEIRISGVHAWIRAGGDRAYDIASAEGVIDAESGDLAFPGEVAGTTSDGVRLAGSDFRYDSEARVIRSEAPVEVAREGFRLRGEGFRAYPEEERFEILRGVRGEASQP